MNNQNKNVFTCIAMACFGLYAIREIYYLLKAIFGGYFDFSIYFTDIVSIIALILVVYSIFVYNEKLLLIGLGIWAIIYTYYLIINFKYLNSFIDFLYLIFWYLLTAIAFILPVVGLIKNDKYKNLYFIGGGLSYLLAHIITDFLIRLIYWVIINGGSFYFSFSYTFSILLISVGLIAYGLSIEK